MVKIPIKQANELFHVFHLSNRLLSKTAFEFIPRLPREPLTDWEDNIIEDDFTERVSLAPTIDLAIEALGPYTPAEYVYAGDLVTDPSDDIPTIKLNKIKLSLPKYGPDFEMYKWLANLYNSSKTSEELKKQIRPYVGNNLATSLVRPSTLPEPLKQQFKYAVPRREANQGRVVYTAS